MVAAANHERHGDGLLRQLLKYYGQNIPVSEKVLKAAAAAAANKSYSGLESLQHLFDHYGASLPVSEEMIKAVAAEWKQREDAVARLLLKSCDTHTSLPLGNPCLRSGHISR